MKTGRSLFRVSIAFAALLLILLGGYLFARLLPGSESERGESPSSDNPLQLQVSGPDGDLYYAAAIGSRIPIEGRDFEIVRVGPWEGLLPDPGGVPMARVSLRSPGGGGTGHFFVTESWTVISDSIALRMFWFENEASATARIRKWQQHGIDDDFTKWGVREGDRIHWFQSLSPGTGIELGDGTTITLLEFDPTHLVGDGVEASIRVRQTRGGSSTETWHAANERDSDSTILFRSLSSYPVHVAVSAWAGDAGALTSYRVGHPARLQEPAALGQWLSVDTGSDLRLDSAIAKGVPVLAKDSPFVEVVLRTGAESLHVRQGEAVRYRDTLLRLLRR